MDKNNPICQVNIAQRKKIDLQSDIIKGLRDEIKLVRENNEGLQNAVEELMALAPQDEKEQESR